MTEQYMQKLAIAGFAAATAASILFTQTSAAIAKPNNQQKTVTDTNHCTLHYRDATNKERRFGTEMPLQQAEAQAKKANAERDGYSENGEVYVLCPQKPAPSSNPVIRFIQELIQI